MNLLFIIKPVLIFLDNAQSLIVLQTNSEIFCSNFNGASDVILEI